MALKLTIQLCVDASHVPPSLHLCTPPILQQATWCLVGRRHPRHCTTATRPHPPATHFLLAYTYIWHQTMLLWWWDLFLLLFMLCADVFPSVGSAACCCLQVWGPLQVTHSQLSRPSRIHNHCNPSQHNI